jgi:hypothetical protein
MNGRRCRWVSSRLILSRGGWAGCVVGPVGDETGRQTVATSTPKGEEDRVHGPVTRPAPETRPPESPLPTPEAADRLQRTETLQKTCRASDRVAVTAA